MLYFLLLFQFLPLTLQNKLTIRSCFYKKTLHGDAIMRYDNFFLFLVGTSFHTACISAAIGKVGQKLISKTYTFKKHRHFCITLLFLWISRFLKDFSRAILMDYCAVCFLSVCYFLFSLPIMDF